MHDASGVGAVTLADGYDVPPIIVGGWQFSTGHRSGTDAVPAATRIQLLIDCADRGLTAFDCADIYGGVEELYGDFLRRYAAERGADARDIRIHTKFVPDANALTTLDRSYVERIVDRSLRRLGVERLDLVQFHWWDFAIERYVETASWLDQCRQAGKIRLLGVTNFDAARLAQLVAAEIPIVTNQVQYSLVDRRPERDLTAAGERAGKHLLAYGTVAGGFLTSRYLGQPEPSPPLSNRSLTKYALIIEECGGWQVFQRLLELLAGIAVEHETTTSAVATRWVLDRPGVSAAVLGLTTTSQVDHAVKCLGLSLSGAETRALDAVVPAAPRGAVYELERDRTGPHGRIMRYELNRGAD